MTRKIWKIGSIFICSPLYPCKNVLQLKLNQNVSKETVCWKELGTRDRLNPGRKESKNFSVVVYNGAHGHHRRYGSVSCCLHHVSLLLLLICPSRFHFSSVALPGGHNPKMAPTVRTAMDVRRLESNRIFLCGEVNRRWLSSSISQ
ncbi:unnamed protein product [Lactuca saligna]|uniref:Uncharacterized protein n=1 Tax=Lactuca saligna TaxID=75948 RepID=A0AA35Z178_LACSI|nr:unnamed protein product [Lactuca saligna]